MSLDWLKHLYGFSNGVYFTVVLILILYGISYRKEFNWRVSVAFFLVAASFVCFGLYNIFYHQIFTNVTASLYSPTFTKFCAMMTPVSVIILTYIYVKSYTIRSVNADALIKKERWLLYFIYLSTLANIVAIYFVESATTIALMLLFGFVVPCIGAARLAMLTNQSSAINKGFAALFVGLLVIIFTVGLFFTNNPSKLEPNTVVVINLASAWVTVLACFFSIRYGYQEMRSFFYIRSLDRKNIMSDITTGINNNQFSLCYQPQLELQTGKITAAEALIRWEHPTKGNISPQDYIPLAEKSGFISEITKWVVKTSLKEAKALREQGFELKISINFSPKDISMHVITHLERMLKRYDYPSYLVVVEITESQMINSNDTVFASAMERLNKLGVSISIDDYGTGFSSLSHMQKLHIDELKVDQTFIKNLAYGSDSYAIVYSTLQMARNLRLVTVAEGVEDHETLQMLKELKCNFAQGFGIAKPMPFDELVVWLENRGTE